MIELTLFAILITFDSERYLVRYDKPFSLIKCQVVDNKHIRTTEFYCYTPQVTPLCTFVHYSDNSLLTYCI